MISPHNFGSNLPAQFSKMICRFGGQISPWLPVGEQSPSRKAKVQPLSEFAGKAVLCRKANKPLTTMAQRARVEGKTDESIDNKSPRPQRRATIQIHHTYQYLS
ncbi:MAG TPA: hypothetical protein VNU68_05240 [Verrucomicrobiae bacterium]|nr:hypothetical protein [Verrucomicrobiae bacterium]